MVSEGSIHGQPAPRQKYHSGKGKVAHFKGGWKAEHGEECQQEI